MYRFLSLEVVPQEGVVAKGVVQPEGPAPKHLEGTHAQDASKSSDHHHHHHHHHGHSKHARMLTAATPSSIGLGLMSVGDLHVGKNAVSWVDIEMSLRTCIISCPDIVSFQLCIFY